MTSPRQPKVRIAELSQNFLHTVFADEFLFGPRPAEVLRRAGLDTAQRRLAMEIHRSELFCDRTWEDCADICNGLQPIFHWQSNSDGPLIFGGKILYLLRREGQDLEWFKKRWQLNDAHRKQRATVIVPVEDGVLLTVNAKGLGLLPGGHIERGELPLAAAARELHEETGLYAQELKFLFEHVSEHYLHHVYLAPQTRGEDRACSDAADLFVLRAQEINDDAATARITASNVAILRRHVAGRG